jgi:1-deoxy-D-xylulose-5-phosphate reductoisomerase
MQGPIAYALSFPQRFCDTVEPLNFSKIGELTFSELDERKFPTIRLAYKALEAGGLMSTVMNAANEVAVQKFCKRIIKFPSIPLVIEKVMGRFQNDRIVNLESILGADRWARRESEKIIEEIK